jgi:hypothetical protein
MLQMVPVGDAEDEREPSGDGSATSFFAIPAPRAKSAPMTPPSTPTPVQAPSSSGFQPPPYNASSAGSAAPPQPMVQGPVASAGNAGASPFQVQGPPPPAAGSDSRVQSTRVLVIVLAVFLLAVMAVLSIVALYFFAQMGTPEPTPEQAPIAKVEVKKERPRDADTGTARPQPPAAPVQAAKPRPKAAGSSAPAAPKPAALGANAAVSASFAGATVPTGVEITCSGGFRQRGSVSGGSVTVQGVPTADTCQMIPKGVPSTAAPVKGGRSYSCTIVGTTTSCK